MAPTGAGGAKRGAAPATLFGVEMKWLALFLLVVQNTALVLLMRSSLTAPGEHYIVTTAVACMEGVKVLACLVVEGWGFPSLAAYGQHLSRELFKPRELAMLAVPSLLYTLQNNLLYIALANLDAAIYQVCYQLKILTTALFSVVLLKRALSRAKWASLVILTLGVSLTELDAHQAKPARAGDTAQSPMLGFLCVLMACLTSGFAGVWFEKILKGVGSGGSKSSSSSSATAGGSSGEAGAAGSSSSSSSSSGQGALSSGAGAGGASAASASSSAPPPIKSMWIRNIQMGLTSVVLALLAVYSKDRAVVAEKGFFYGYNSSVVGVILLQALGGLVVAAVVKYADNILKGFGSSISIVISCTLEWLCFDFHPTLRFLLGAGLVNAALYVYQDDRIAERLAGVGGAGKGVVGSGAGGGEDGLPLLPLHSGHHHHHHHKDSSDESSGGGGPPAVVTAGGIALAPATKVYEGVGTLTARSSISSNAATSPTGSSLLFGGNSKRDRDLKSLV